MAIRQRPFAVSLRTRRTVTQQIQLVLDSMKTPVLHLREPGWPGGSALSSWLRRTLGQRSQGFGRTVLFGPRRCRS
eukprot:7843691-Lingulodinium_polyedra.AAC.2